MSRAPDVRRILAEIVSRKDPQGYYVVPVRLSGSRLRLEELEKLAASLGASVEQVGDVVLLRVKSRRAAARLVENLLKAGAELGA